MRAGGVRRSAALLGGLALIVAAAAAADRPAAAETGQKTREAAISSRYDAGGFHRWLWGSDYRDLWGAPVTAEVLDLQTFAGGLKPVLRVGGQQTKGLALKGADGRDYTFRAIDKDPTTILPEELQDTWVRNIVQDQMSGQHPASAFVVEELMEAAGVLHTAQHLVVMPDDPALGEFRKDFAGVIGQLFEYPQAKAGQNPGFHDATAVLKHKDLYKLLEADPRNRVDTRAFLKARLLDIMVGDWDRHRDQWRWAQFPGDDHWKPIPDDRDQAFSRYEGLILAFARGRAPILQSYASSYPAMKGLTWNGWEQDRELLAGLERPVFREVAAELKSQMTDAVIDRAVQRVPSAYFKVDGARLGHDLKGRRDRLVEAADAFYEHIADKVKVYLTDAPEHVAVTWLDGGDALVLVSSAGPDGQPVGDPFYRRTLHRRETQEVQVYLRGGNDRVVTAGRPSGLELRVVGGGDRDVVDDTKGGGTRFYDTGSGELQRGPGSSLHRRAYVPPAPPKNAPWIPPRDWGRDTFWVPWLAYGSDLGAFVGLGVDTQSHAFRKDPYGVRHVLRAGWSFGESTFRADYVGRVRFENSPWQAGVRADASGIESSRFFGFGNETGDGGDDRSDFFRVKQKQYSFSPAFGVEVAPNLTLSAGPTLKYASVSHQGDDTLLNRQRPYGYGGFGEVGATGILELDTRKAASRTPGGVALRGVGYPVRGAHVLVRGQIWPEAWDVASTFGAVDGSAAAYLTPGGDRAPTLGLRVGGRKVFGDYPFFEAAYLGGGLGGISAGQSEEPVRGLQRHRYAGDAAVYGNADLRLYVSRFRIVLPGTWGVFGFGDGGRVYLEREDSSQWHYGYGGGIWFAWLDRSNALSFTYARSSEGSQALYFRAGFAF
jgi:hypothetical protein